MKRRISILGSTGSIGKQTCEVAEALDLDVRVLVAHSSVETIFSQAKRLDPDLVVLEDETAAKILADKCQAANLTCQVLGGRENVLEASRYEEVDIVVSSLVGMAGLEPTLQAIKANKTIALANKESLVVAGDLLLEEVDKHKVSLYPVDSEHSAIWQALAGGKASEVHKLFLTCSGGPFRGKKRADLFGIQAADALKHPTWQMGAKISIDSSTLMNKAFELIEACHLFNVPEDKVEVVVHPESLIHSMVEFIDHSVLAQLSFTDMKLPIQYALTYPERKESLTPAFDPFDPKYKNLHFEPVDEETFKAIQLAREVFRGGRHLPIIFNATNEIAVKLFLEDKIKYLQIIELIETALEKVTIDKSFNHYNLEDVLSLDQSTRQFALEIGETWKD